MVAECLKVVSTGFPAAATMSQGFLGSKPAKNLGKVVKIESAN